MASQVLDVEALLDPIPGENPAGEYLRYAGTYDAIEAARREDPLEADDSIWKRELKTADWPAVIELCTTALQTQSKDVQIAAWLTEALVKQYGCAGLRDGLRLLRELQERFWEVLYPEIEDGDLELRAGPLEWLNEKLPLSIKSIPVTQSIGGAHYTFLNQEESRRIDNLGRQDQEAMEQALADGKITGEQFDNAVTATPLTFYDMLLEALAESREEYTQLDQVIDAKFVRDAPSLLDIKKALEDCWELVEGILKKRRPPESNLPGRLDGPASPNGRGAPTQVRSNRPERRGRTDQDGPSTDSLPLEPLDRTDAFRRLEAVAAYFRQTEPQSPVPYAIELAVRWGEMSLEEWLREVIKGEDVLSQVFVRLGVQPTEDNNDTEKETV